MTALRQFSWKVQGLSLLASIFIFTGPLQASSLPEFAWVSGESVETLVTMGNRSGQELMLTVRLKTDRTDDAPPQVRLQRIKLRSGQEISVTLSRLLQGKGQTAQSEILTGTMKIVANSRSGAVFVQLETLNRSDGTQTTETLIQAVPDFEASVLPPGCIDEPCEDPPPPPSPCNNSLLYRAWDTGNDGVPDPSREAEATIFDCEGNIIDSAVITPSTTPYQFVIEAPIHITVGGGCGGFFPIGNGNCSTRLCSVHTRNSETGTILSTGQFYESSCTGVGGFDATPLEPSPDTMLPNPTSDPQTFYNRCHNIAKLAFINAAPVAVRATDAVISGAAEDLFTTLVIDAVTGAGLKGFAKRFWEMVIRYAAHQDLTPNQALDMLVGLSPDLEEAVMSRSNTACLLIGAEKACQDQTELLFGQAAPSPQTQQEVDSVIRNESETSSGLFIHPVFARARCQN